MKQYRICPSGAIGWKVQGRWLGLIWYDLYEMVGLDYFERIEFETEVEADRWAQGRLTQEAAIREDRRVARLRRQSIKPRAALTTDKSNG